MNLCSVLGTSSGGLNIGGNLLESSFLEALFGLEFGHADFADDAVFCSSSITHHNLLEKTGKLLIAIGIACVTD